VIDLNPPPKASAAILKVHVEVSKTESNASAVAGATAAPVAVVPPSSAPQNAPSRTVARSSAPAISASPVPAQSIVVASSTLQESASNSSEHAAAPPTADVTVDVAPPLPGNPYLHVLTDVLSALKRAVTQVCAHQQRKLRPSFSIAYVTCSFLCLPTPSQHHFSMLLVATGLVFIIAGGSVSSARPK
jgi:hypothetical protein